MKTLDNLYALFVRVAKSLQSPFLLFVRVFWGWQFIVAGKGKLADIPRFVDLFAGWGVPAPNFTVHFIALLEVGGGILLILGLASRLIALPLVINMITAYVIADREALKAIFSDGDKFINAAPCTFLIASLIILVFGSGLFSVDSLIAKVRAKKAAS
ncbi:MAG TPA: DoxX family protein [Candidatus Angelobacter sp.]|nr:DoxX family protein [Candidatus Angelobacter sp.]